MTRLKIANRWRGIAVGVLSVACATSALAAQSTESTHPLPRITQESLQPDPAARDRSVVDDRIQDATWSVSSGEAAVTSPGLQIGITTWDRQHLYSNGHQVAANPGADVVHFTWFWWDDFAYGADYDERFVVYNAYSISSGTFYFDVPWDPAFLSLGEIAEGRYPRLDVGTDGKAHVVFHQRTDIDAPYHAWHLYLPVLGSAMYLGTELGAPPQTDGSYWPDVAVAQRSGGDIYHVLATPLIVDGSSQLSTGHIAYHRYDAGAPAPTWEGPVILDSTHIPAYVVDADDNSSRVAMAFHSAWYTDGLNELSNIACLESQTDGAGWIDGSELGPGYRNLITGYHDEAGPQAWPHISIAYDHAGRLHIVFSEQRYADISEQVVIRHWNGERGTVRTVALGYYNNPGIYERSVNLDQVTLGIGDGGTTCLGGAESNEDYLYVLYTKLGGETPEEQADLSQLGYANGELYLTVSRDLGAHWSTPVNLTNTKTPNCTTTHTDSVCASEAWATIARDVGDINIFYILDRGAGDVYEAPWTMNDAMYLRYPGGTVDAPYVCPECICPCHGDPQCDGIKNVLDVVLIINEAFRSAPPLIDPGCPHVSRCDMNCDCTVDVLDVVIGVNYAFRWDIMPVCDPCEESCP